MPTPLTPIEALVGKMKADSAIVALVGVRIYPGMPTQDPSGDYICLRKTSGGNDQRLDGNNQLNRYSIRVDAFSTNEATAEAILAAINNCLGGWRDLTQNVYGCFNDSDSDESIEADAGGGVYRVSGQSFNVWFKG